MESDDLPEKRRDSIFGGAHASHRRLNGAICRSIYSAKIEFQSEMQTVYSNHAADSSLRRDHLLRGPQLKFMLGLHREVD